MYDACTECLVQLSRADGAVLLLLHVDLCRAEVSQ